MFAFRLKWMEMIFIKQCKKEKKKIEVIYLETLVVWLK